MNLSITTMVLLSFLLNIIKCSTNNIRDSSIIKDYSIVRNNILKLFSDYIASSDKNDNAKNLIIQTINKYKTVNITYPLDWSVILKYLEFCSNSLDSNSLDSNNLSSNSLSANNLSANNLSSNNLSSNNLTKEEFYNIWYYYNMMDNKYSSLEIKRLLNIKASLRKDITNLFINGSEIHIDDCLNMIEAISENLESISFKDILSLYFIKFLKKCKNFINKPFRLEIEQLRYEPELNIYISKLLGMLRIETLEMSNCSNKYDNSCIDANNFINEQVTNCRNESINSYSSIFNDLKNNKWLKTLKINNTKLLLTDAISISNLLENKNCNLLELELIGNSIDKESIAILFNGINNNKTLIRSELTNKNNIVDQ